MATATGPLFSEAATGTFGDLVTFQNWRGHQTLRKKPSGKNPNSKGQLAHRAYVRAAANSWRDNKALLTILWQNYAISRKLPIYNAIVENWLHKLANGRPPDWSPTPPFPNADLPPIITAITAQRKQVTIEFTFQPILTIDMFAVCMDIDLAIADTTNLIYITNDITTPFVIPTKTSGLLRFRIRGITRQFGWTPQSNVVQVNVP